MTAPTVHIVAKGEYLFKILRQNGFSETEAQVAMTLMGKDPKAYGITSGNVHVVYPGDTLTLPDLEEVRAQVGSQAVDNILAAQSGPFGTDASDAQSNAFADGSLGRLAAMLDMFTAPTDPVEVPKTALAEGAVVDRRQSGRTTITAGELMGRRKSDPDTLRTQKPAEEDVRKTQVRDPEPPKAPPVARKAESPRRQLTPFVDAQELGFEYARDDQGFNLLRRFNPENPVLWMNYSRCHSCRRTCKLCILMKYLTAAELWEAIG